MSPVDVVSLGEPLYELNRQPDGNWLTGFGGDTLNVAIAAARLGATAAYVTRLGDDIFAEELRALMQRESIDISAVAQDRGAPTGLYFVTHGPSGHVFTYRRSGSAASRMTPADLDPMLIASARFLHASGISQAISASAAETVAAAIAMARRAGVRVSYDTNFRPRLWEAAKARPVIETAAAHACILKTSVEDAEALYGMTDPAAIGRHFLGLGASAVIITRGKDGAALVTRGGVEHVPVRKVAAVDATGAGDAFTGALLAQLARGHTVSAAARFANAAAGLSTLAYGAIAPLPRRPAVEAFLAGAD
ncbi:sugar kinase [Aestuariivirga sp.]|uniref:sugar kinase n=1 Tax=Aestuariivirga sp. TaxID=2650926 RepID=UPI0025C6FEE9|nr:sugar kinase [Aestuariivirga sp.]